MFDDFQNEFFSLRASTSKRSEQFVQQLKHEVQSGKLTMIEIDINPQSKRFLKTIDDYIFNLLDLYDLGVTLEQNLDDLDLIYIVGPLLKRIIKKYVQPKLENYCAGKRLG